MRVILPKHRLHRVSSRPSAPPMNLKRIPRFVRVKESTSQQFLEEAERFFQDKKPSP